jgi:hypothetical protein
MVLATFRSGVYNTLLLVHILLAIVGFGGVMLNGVYAMQAKKRGGREGLAISEANEFVSGHIAELFIYGVFVLGVLLLIAGRPVVKFSQGWVWGSVAIYAVAVGVVQSVLIPGHRRLNQLMAELVSAPAGGEGAGPPPQVAQLAAIERRVAAVGGFLQVLLVAILFLMVFKPGGPSV